MILFLYDLCHFQILSVTQDETCDLAHLTKTDAIDAIMYVCWNFLLLPYPLLFFVEYTWLEASFLSLFQWLSNRAFALLRVYEHLLEC